MNERQSTPAIFTPTRNMMMRELFELPMVMLRYWRLARRSVPAEAWEYFKVLVALHLKWKWHGLNGPCTQRMLGFTVTGSDAGTLKYLFEEVFLRGDYAFDADSDAPLIIDCGANAGMAILYFKRRWPKARIIAFEANPQVFAFLEMNVRQNDLRDVGPHNVALADKPGMLAFFVNGHAGTLTGSVRSDRGGSTRIEVPAETLSSHLVRLNGPVDAVKIDIEGAEWMVLRDLVSTSTLTRPERYLVEYHHRIAGEKSRLAEFLAPFEAAGFDHTLRAQPKPGAVFQDMLIKFTRRAGGNEREHPHP